MRQMRIKKSRRHQNRPVQVLTQRNGRIEVSLGYLKGYLGNDILIDTGNGLYEHVAMGNAPGTSLVLPIGTKVRIGKPAASKNTAQKGVSTGAYVQDPDSEPEKSWEDQLPALCDSYDSDRYPEPDQRLSVSESHWL